MFNNVTMLAILKATHIKPFKYNGEGMGANGFVIRANIHTLFDAGNLLISVGVVEELLGLLFLILSIRISSAGVGMITTGCKVLHKG